MKACYSTSRSIISELPRQCDCTSEGSHVDALNALNASKEGFCIAWRLLQKLALVSFHAADPNCLSLATQTPGACSAATPEWMGFAFTCSAIRVIQQTLGRALLALYRWQKCMSGYSPRG